MSASQIVGATAAQLSQGYAAGRLSPVDVVHALLAHISRCEPHLHALYTLDGDAALAAARASEQRWRAGSPRSALDGVPVTVKENIATRGDAVPLGTAATDETPAHADAPPAARLREAGAVILGKTTMPDYGMLSSGLSSRHPLTRNPWNLALNPGGSSAGAGAAAAAGYAPLHLGTDIGGSIRLPAAWCGIVGFKPSLGRVPIHPPYAGRAAGPMARTVADCAAAMSTLAQPDRRDSMSLPPQMLDWSLPGDEELLATLRGRRIGLWLDAGWGMAPEPRILEVTCCAAQAFAEHAGCEIVEIQPFCTPQMGHGMDSFWRMRSWLDLQALAPERRERVLPYIRAWTEPAAHYTGAQVFEFQAQMHALREASVAAMREVDVLLSPTAPVASFPAEHPGPTNDVDRALDHIGFTLPLNMGEQPAISVDAGLTMHDGRRIGLQIAGQRHADVDVLRWARAWEILRGPMQAWPQPPLA